MGKSVIKHAAPAQALSSRANGQQNHNFVASKAVRKVIQGAQNARIDFTAVNATK